MKKAYFLLFALSCSALLFNQNTECQKKLIKKVRKFEQALIEYKDNQSEENTSKVINSFNKISKGHKNKAIEILDSYNIDEDLYKEIVKEEDNKGLNSDLSEEAKEEELVSPIEEQEEKQSEVEEPGYFYCLLELLGIINIKR